LFPYATWTWNNITITYDDSNNLKLGPIYLYFTDENDDYEYWWRDNYCINNDGESDPGLLLFASQGFTHTANNLTIQLSSDNTEVW